MSNDCSQHPKDLFGESDMRKVAEAIENLSYEVQPELFKRLADAYEYRSDIDYEEGKGKLGNHGSLVAELLRKVYGHSLEMKLTSAPFMKDNKTDQL